MQDAIHDAQFHGATMISDAMEFRMKIGLPGKENFGVQQIGR